MKSLTYGALFLAVSTFAACSGADGKPASMASFTAPTAAVKTVQADGYGAGGCGQLCGDEQQMSPMSVKPAAEGVPPGGLEDFAYQKVYRQCMAELTQSGALPYTQEAADYCNAMAIAATTHPPTPPPVGVPHDPAGCRGQDCSPL